jgi:hypothetical protein
MHTHVIINHDVGLVLVVKTEQEEVDTSDIIDQLIVEELSNATAGIQET